MLGPRQGLDGVAAGDEDAHPRQGVGGDGERHRRGQRQRAGQLTTSTDTKTHRARSGSCQYHQPAVTQASTSSAMMK
jgi:hypothetical protein